MGQNKDDLRQLLAFIDTLTKQPGNEGFIAGLRALVYNGKTPERKDLEEIKAILKIRGTQSIDYSFVDHELTRNQLIMDNIRMEDSLLDNSLSIEDKWYEFCSYAHLQVENLLNLYFNKFFGTPEKALSYINENSKQEFRLNNNYKSIENIPISSKIYAFCNENLPYTPNLIDYTLSNIKLVREVRNEYFHRSTITNEDSKSALKNAYTKSSFESIRRALISISEIISNKLRT